MSFSSDVKEELCKVRAAGCCVGAECYGLLLFGHAFSPQSISLVTEHEAVALRFTRLLRACFDVRTSLRSSGMRRELYTVSVAREADRLKVFHLLRKERVMDRIRRQDCCGSAFLRGAFLACGSIADPHKEYHAEFMVQDRDVADELSAILQDWRMQPLFSDRETGRVIYFKGSGQIEDLLTRMRATAYTLELMNIRIVKDVRNSVNRRTNCETANISRTVAASLAQCRAIERLRRTGRYETLPDGLKETAALRLSCPDESLETLAARCGLSRSGLAHRLRKLVAIAKEAEKGG